MTTAVEKAEYHAPAVSDSAQLTSSQVAEQVQLIQQILRGVMVEGEHYGIIPGTNGKPSLLKSGAEKLCMTFRLAPSYEIERIDHAGGHREYIVKTKLTHITTGKVWGEGVGSCSTLEKKYRYRNDYKPTGRPVPKSYWKDRDATLLGGKGFVPKKDDQGAWWIFESNGQQENPDLAEQYNTVLKMAKKRSLTDGTLAATAASDLFTQDIDENFDEHNSLKSAPAGKTDQQRFEEARGITPQHVETPDVQPEPPTETPEEKAKREKGEKRAAIMNAMPKDIQEYLVAALRKGLKLVDWFQMIADNEQDHERIRGWMQDHPLAEPVADLSQLNESMPTTVPTKDELF